MSLIHEFLHPSQITRTLAETGSLDAGDSEARTQMREQKIAEELGKIPGKDFPDVFESGPYGVRLDPAETPPRSTLPDDPALPVDPMKYDARTSPSPTEPISLRLDDMSAPRLVRVNGSSSAAFPAASAALSDNHNPWNNRFGSGTSSFDGITPRYPNVPASPLETEGRLGIGQWQAYANFSGADLRCPRSFRRDRLSNSVLGDPTMEWREIASRCDRYRRASVAVY